MKKLIAVIRRGLSQLGWRMLRAYLKDYLGHSNDFLRRRFRLLRNMIVCAVYLILLLLVATWSMQQEPLALLVTVYMLMLTSLIITILLLLFIYLLKLLMLPEYQYVPTEEVAFYNYTHMNSEEVNLVISVLEDSRRGRELRSLDPKAKAVILQKLTAKPYISGWIIRALEDTPKQTSNETTCK